jgi:hypothetical protein
MTTIRGKQPIECTVCPTLEVRAHAQQIVVKSGVWVDGGKVEIRGTLEVHCARNLILELRRGLRQIRDETRQRLDKAVEVAEGALP